MRNFGSILMILGIGGFFYCSSRLSDERPLAPDQSISASLDQPAGRWEMGRYACAGAAGFGLLMAMFPKGR
jgi:hypothetical protein